MLAAKLKGTGGSPRVKAPSPSDGWGATVSSTHAPMVPVLLKPNHAQRFSPRKAQKHTESKRKKPSQFARNLLAFQTSSSVRFFVP